MQKAVRGSLGADVDALAETCEYRARTKQRQGVDGLTGQRLGGVGPWGQLSDGPTGAPGAGWLSLRTRGVS